MRERGKEGREEARSGGSVVETQVGAGVEGDSIQRDREQDAIRSQRQRLPDAPKDRHDTQDRSRRIAETSAISSRPTELSPKSPVAIPGDPGQKRGDGVRPAQGDKSREEEEVPKSGAEGTRTFNRRTRR